jgi:DNA-directed RNA polymerase beta' subunit
MQSYKSNAENNDQFWSAVQSGDPLPPPRPTFAYNKFTNLMKTIGVNMEKQGNNINLMPLTDKQVLEMSNGEIKDAGKMLIGKNLKEEKKGLFDKDVTGGRDGAKWSHIKLPEPMPNPVFEKSILSLTGLKQKELDGLMTGKSAIDPKTGKFTTPDKGISSGPAVNILLKKIDVEKDLATAQAELKSPGLKGNRLDRANKKVKYLQNLKKLGMTPTEAYMTQHVPVMPPSMRPMSALPDGTIINDDLNHMYKGLGIAANKFKDTNKHDLPEEFNKRRAAIYDGMKALTGVGGHLNRKYRGVLDVISGKTIDKDTKKKTGKPAESYFQSKLIKRKQDMSMRSTIIPEPELGLDQVGVPKKAAMEVYKPFVVRELRGIADVTPLKAQQMIKDGDPLAKRALERVVAERPLMLKRDPVLHKYGVQAFKPVLTSGKAVKIHPLVTSGFNADFDGDSTLGEVVILSLKRYKGGTKEGLMPHTRSVVSHKIIDLEDFPRIEGSEVVKKSGVVEYDVPDDIFVPALQGTTMRMMPVTKYSVHPDCEEWLTKTINGREIISSRDHSLALLDPKTLEVVKSSPRDAVGRCMPIMRRLRDLPTVTRLEGSKPKNTRSISMQEDVKLTWDVGWFLGVTIGDGWITHCNRPNKYGDYGEVEARTVNLAYGEDGDDVADRWWEIGGKLSKNRYAGETSFPHKFRGHKCLSRRLTISSTALGLWTEPLVGKRAEGKHLPEDFMNMPREFRRGLFCGLIDTDGTVNWNKRDQFSLSFSTISKRLADEISILGLSLGLHGNRTLTKTPAGKPSFLIHFSINPVQEARWIELIHKKKHMALKKLWSSEEITMGRNDFVPLPRQACEELLEHLKSLGAAVRPPNRNTRAFSQYVVLRRFKDTVTRQSVEILADLVSQCPISAYLDQWFVLALDRTVGWDLVTSSEPTGRKVEMYDITVPEAWTFTMANGAVVWDTMSAFVPVGHEAVAEARKMYPSRNLFSPATGSLMYRPTHESQLGLYTLTQEGKNTGKSFKSMQEAAKAAQDGKIGMNDLVHINKTRTSVGRALVANALPKAMQADVLRGRTPLDGKGQEALLSQVAKSHKNDFGDVANKLKDIGNRYATTNAVSIGLDDIKADKVERNRILAAADRKVAEIMSGKGTPEQKEKMKVQVYDRASEQMVKAIDNKHGRAGSAIHTMMKAGVKPKMGAYRQITMAPMLMMNAKGEVIPNPIRKSWSEGLDVGDYWTQMSGARKGVVQKVQSVQQPGYFTKQVINSVMNNSIGTDDCATGKGISLPVDEKDILDRYLASDMKSGSKSFKAGTLITPGVRDSMRNNKVRRVVVRSPLRCEHGDGICARCYGLDEDGTNPTVGKNVGIMSAQSIGERATQLSMRTFHEGGIAPVGKKGRQAAALTDEFQRVQQLTLMPKHVPGAAPLSTLNGKVTKVVKDPAGGHNVFINDVRHYVPQDRGEPMAHVGDKAQKVRRGMQIGKGSPLSAGPVNMNEMLPLTGINKVQGYMAGQLYDIYKGEGIRRRNIETVVKSMTNLTQVKDPGDHREYLRGDFVPTSQVQALNKRLATAKKKPVVHTPVLKGVKTLPLDMQTDWMARLNHENLNATIVDAANQGWTSNIHGQHPVPALAYGAEFGKKKPY